MVVDKVEVLILVENTVYRHSLLAEHGFSALVTVKDANKSFTLLFDTGQTGDALLKNAAELKAPLEKIEAIVISHGHYDHGGGLLKLKNRLAGRKVYIHPDAFTPKYKKSKHETRYIGLDYKPDNLYPYFHLVLSREPTLIDENVMTTGEIPKTTDFEEADIKLCIKKNDSFEPDPLVDEQALIIKHKEGLIVIVGCSHPGIINILRHAVNMAGDNRIYAVIGGFHLLGASKERIAKTVNELQMLRVQRVVPLHCTGFTAKMMIAKAIPQAFIDASTGTLIEL